MISRELKIFLEERLSEVLARAVHLSGVTRVNGGSINGAFLLHTNSGELFFLKTNDRELYPGLFEKERAALITLQPFFRTPSVLVQDVCNDKQVLVMEWIPTGTRTDKFWEDFGKLYNLLRKKLLANKKGYTGMILRDVAEKLKALPPNGGEA